MEKENKKLKITANKKVVVFSLIALALLIIGSTSYAYFTAVIEGNDTAKQTSVTSGTMSVKLINTEEINLNGMMPGDSKTVHFSVQNTGSATATYGVGLLVSENNFGDKTDLVYTITSDNDGGSKGQSVLPSKSTTTSTLISVVSIPTGKTQNYTMTITFLETNDDQNDNQGKTFSGKIQLVDANRNLLVSRILSDNELQTGEPVWGYESLDKGLYKESGDKTIEGIPTYYYRGDVDNNYVQLGTYKPVYIVGNNSLYPGAAMMTATLDEATDACNDWQLDYTDGNSCVDNIISNSEEVGKPMIWRIVRINEDGTIRLILDQGINDNYEYKFSYADDAAALDEFDYGASNIRDRLNEWYNIQLKDNSNLVNSIYCSEIRSEADIFNYNTTLNCSKDNQIKSKIELLTADEALYAGMGIEHTANKSSSYLKGVETWLLTPTYYDNNGIVYEGSFTEGSASIYFDYLNYNFPLRPVINVKADALITSGNGTKNNPYVVE